MGTSERILTGGGVGGGVGCGGGVLGGDETGESPNSGNAQSSLLSLRNGRLAKDMDLGVELAE